MTYKEAAAYLRAHDRYLILSHVRPDGDTVGCAAGLCRALRQAGKTAYVLENPELTTPYAPYFAPYLAPAGYEPGCVVAVDAAAPGMLPGNADAYRDRIGLAIDHHPSHRAYAEHTLVDASCAACGEIIYALCRELTGITAEIALPLYVAISTDTGCFRYGNTTANAHRVAAALMETGIDTAAANKKHFRTKSKKRMYLEMALMENMEFFREGRIAVASVTLALMERLGATEDDADDLAGFPGQIEGVLCAVTLRELTDGRCRISLRTSAGWVDANKVCALLGGGGHAAAAGATVPGAAADGRRAVLEAIDQILDS